ncbi:MAG TPA: xanthine dehydrogenase family protein molybdopterin-binding subunit [Phycisphaerae bacterium]|nr:xanthine dehydrogenase family protein molybdopterin-binding subunit [Phycisphaerae bacterium]
MPTTQPGKKTILVPKIVNGVPSGEEEIVVDDTDAPAWGPKDKHRLINTYLPRADGPHKATGTAVYTHDVKVPNMAYACFVTSPHAHARIKSVNKAAAEEVPGVLAVVPFPNLEEVRFEGQPVAAVAAKTLEAAEEAAHAVAIEWEQLPFVVTAEDAMKPGAPAAVNGGGGGRGGFRGGGNRGGNPEQVLDALKSCDVTVEATYTSVIMHHCCLETHSVVCDYSGGDSATVYCSTQGCNSIATDAARELGLPASKIAGIVYNMGGGFGSKFGIGIVGQWACRLSKKLSQPVKLVLTRREEFLGAGNGPGAIQTFKAGATKDGKLVAVHCIQHALPGIGRSNIAAQPYQYHAEHTYREQTTVNTNEDSSVAMRAPGHPQACFAMESLMDELAEKLGMDPVEFRKKNVPDPAWVRQLDAGAKAIGWNRNKTPGKSANGSSLVRGMGCGIGAWGGGGRGGCVATVNIGQDGSVTVQNASQDLGTGTRTYVRAIVAEELGLDYNDVLEEIGDSRFTNGVASGGSTTAASLAPAVKDAAYNARTEMANRVAPHLGADPSAVLFADRQIAGNGKALPWKQACAFLPSGGLSVRGEWKPGLSGNGAHGASFAEVEVDMETGHVRVVKMAHVQDGGLILNRMGAESQINGGMIQSLGMALYEGRVMDSNLGVMVNPAFNDYKLPGCLEIPELIPIIDDGDERNQVIGLAEPANIPGSGAIANAVANAIGVRIRELPITPDKILNALAQQKNV